MLTLLSQSAIIQLAILLPIIGALGVWWLGERNRNLRELVSLTTAICEFGLVASLTPDVLAGARPSVDMFEMMPGLMLSFSVEPLGQIFALVASGLWIINTIYSIGYMRSNNEGNQTRFYIFFAVAISASIGIAYAGNLLTLFVFYEVLTLSTYPLVTHAGTDDAIRGGRVYLGILMSTSIGFLFMAMVWTYNITGTLDFTEGGILNGQVQGPELAVLMVLYMYGIGKAALMPAHRWLPAAMVAPTPVSSLLHAVAVVKAGVFTIVKVIVYIFGLDLLVDSRADDWLLLAAGFTIIAASIIALKQTNLKKRLAYSTISQLSYVILGAAILAPISVMGAAIHIAIHALGKITLFFAAGAVYTATHKTHIHELGGIAKRMPFTMLAFAVGGISMIGLPPTAGFISKWYILSGALETGSYIAVAVIIGSTLLNAAYFLPIIYAAYFKPEVLRLPDDPNYKYNKHGEAPVTMLIAMACTSLGTIALFFMPDTLLALGRALVGL